MFNFNETMYVSQQPEPRKFADGTPYVNLACARSWNSQGPDGQNFSHKLFLDITYKGRLAELICENFKVGDPIKVFARLEISEWVDKDTGQKRQRIVGRGQSFEYTMHPETLAFDRSRRMNNRAVAAAPVAQAATQTVPNLDW